jgi:hypothetical protein
MKIPKSLAKELKVAGISSERKVNEIIASLAAAAEAAQSKEMIGAIQSAITDLKKHNQSTINAFERVDFALNNPHEYEVEIIRDDDGIAERFIMHVRGNGVAH